MLRSLLAAALALTLVAGPGFTQERQAPAAQGGAAMVGLVVYSSDGQKLGQITEVGMAGTVPAVRAQIGGFLDVAPSAVLIPIAMSEQKPDRIELSLTAVEVKDAIDKQKQ